MSPTVKKLAELLGLLAALATVVLWATDRLEAKASVARVEVLERQQHDAEVVAARMDERLGYLVKAVDAIATRVGAIAPVPPNP